MKYPFFVKSALVACSALALMNCGEDAANIANQVANNADIAGLASSASAAGVTVSEACWVVNADQTYLINTSYIVTDVNGSPVGVYDPATQSITAVNGTPILNSVDLGTLEVKAEGDVIIPVAAASSAATAILPGVSSASVLNPALSSAATTPATGTPSAALSSAAVVPTSSATVPQAASSNSQQQQQQAKSSSSQQQQAQQGTDGTCFDSYSGKYVKPGENLKGSDDASYTYNTDCTVNCYWSRDNSQCGFLTSGTTQQASSTSQQQQQQTQSSSSQQQQQQAKSSSSQQQVQSSSSQQAQGVTPNFAIKSGGRSGSGWGSRYWDCCKPHCAWTGKGGKMSRTCNANQQTLANDDQIKSICDGGAAATCNDQRPIAINDNLAYAYAAGPGNSYAGSCGSCFLLTFTGESRHTTDARTAALKGKQMVIMISNIGYDVEDGQFDMMIPGGGVGAFNGCSTLWGISNLGAQHGGFLKDCGGDTKTDNVAGMQKCLEEKCNTVFANIPDAKAGCLFHAQWLMAANNPSFTYQELESCPSELTSRF